MPPLDTTRPPWRDRLWAELKRDKKKSSVLAGLLAVAAVLGVRMLAQALGSAPAVATAAVAPSPGGAMPGLTPAGGPAPVAFSPPEPGRNPLLTGGSLRTVRAHAKIARDIFSPQLDLFPLEKEPEPVTASAPAPQPVDQESVRREAVLAKAKGLVLQSTIISSRPKAIINGQLAGVGDVIDGFQVVQVTAHACVLLRDGVQVTLEMKDQ